MSTANSSKILPQKTVAEAKTSLLLTAVRRTTTLRELCSILEGSRKRQDKRYLRGLRSGLGEFFIGGRWGEGA